MAVYYCDSSGIIKRYVGETGTPWVVALADPAAGNRIHLARITGVEVVAGITRRQRLGSISAAEATALLARFQQHFATEYRVAEITPQLVAQAMNLARKHALRAYDAVQLAAALDINALRLRRRMAPLILVSADVALNTAATAEGFTVDDPNAHP